ncbi:MAG: hypothetical protein ACT4PU_06890 [Planctomycetota bacterium]
MLRSPNIKPWQSWSHGMVLVALLCLHGCLAVPPAAVQARLGVVRAHDPELAARLARHLDQDLPRLRELVPGLTGQPVEVWIEPALRVLGISLGDEALGIARHSHDRVHVLVLPTDAEMRSAMLHELVHLLQDQTWNALPKAASEGLADLGPTLVDSSLLAVDHQMRLGSLLLGLGCREVQLPYSNVPGATISVQIAPVDDRGREGFGSLLEDGRVQLHSRRWIFLEGSRYGAGYLLVRRIVARRGLAGLRALCIEALAAGQTEVSYAVLLEAADLDEDPATWKAAAEAEWLPSG